MSPINFVKKLDFLDWNLGHWCCESSPTSLLNQYTQNEKVYKILHICQKITGILGVQIPYLDLNLYCLMSYAYLYPFTSFLLIELKLTIL